MLEKTKNNLCNVKYLMIEDIMASVVKPVAEVVRDA